MIRISKKQLDRFEEAARARLHEKILFFLKKHLTAQTQDQDEQSLLRQIAEYDQKASMYGVRTAASVTQFVVFSMLSGIDLDLNPAVKRFLLHPELTGDQKMKLLSNMFISNSKKTR